MAARTKKGANRDKRMSLGQHLIEFRNRLIKSAIALVVAMVVGWILSDFVMSFLREPVLEIATAQGRAASLNFTDITGAFDLKLQIAFTVGIVLSAPVWLYQIWAFIVPGLTRTERKYAIGFVGAAVPLFFLGCAAGLYVLPRMVGLLTSFAPSEDTAIISARGYFDFVLKLVIVIGIAFVLPVFVVLLNFAGVLTAKAILKSWRVAVLSITLFTAIATPSADVISMFLLAIPMVMLYFIAAGIATLHDKRAAKRQATLDAEYAVG